MTESISDKKRIGLFMVQQIILNSQGGICLNIIVVKREIKGMKNSFAKIKSCDVNKNQPTEVMC